MPEKNAPVLVQLTEIGDSPVYHLIENPEIIEWFDQEVDFAEHSCVEQTIPGTDIEVTITVGSPWNDKVLSVTEYAGGRVPGARALNDAEADELTRTIPHSQVIEALIY